MDVLAIDAKAELPGVDLIPDREQPFDDRGAVFCVDDLLLREHLRVRDRALDVLAVEPAVEVDRRVVGLDQFVGRALETATPELLFRSRARCALITTTGLAGDFIES